MLVCFLRPMINNVFYVLINIGSDPLEAAETRCDGLEESNKASRSFKSRELEHPRVDKQIT